MYSKKIVTRRYSGCPRDMEEGLKGGERVQKQAREIA
jgi:hypothetical protein